MKPINGAPGPTAVRNRSAAPVTRSPAATLRFDIQRITLPRTYTPTQRDRFTTTLSAALTQLAAKLTASQFATVKRIGHLESARLGEGATPEEAALEVANQIMASVQKSPTKQVPRGGAGVTDHV